VKDEPVGVVLLDVRIVVWRDVDGVARAFVDQCVHRGVALSLGRVIDGELSCAYHGWRYGADGACTFIPQLADPTRVPRKARVKSFLCVERHGLVWVALEEPPYPLPDIAELTSDQYRPVLTGPFAWDAAAARQLENFTDFGHFPFVHPGLLGDPERTQVPEHTVAREGHVLRYEITRPESPNSDEFPIFANRQAGPAARHSRYEIHLPYTLLLRIDWGGAERMVYLFASRPVSDTRCVGYCLVARNYDLDQDDRVIEEFEEVIFEQDRRIVQSQRPHNAPLDLSEELHLTFDAVAIAYRRALDALFE
jgi:vanillate O-demethylase monooxygenase subunit